MQVETEAGNNLESMISKISGKFCSHILFREQPEAARLVLVVYKRGVDGHSLVPSHCFRVIFGEP